MGENEDYAVAAAREWFAETQTGLDANKLNYPTHNEVWVGQQLALDHAIEKLAAIIRKHIESVTLKCGCKGFTPDCKAR